MNSQDKLKVWLLRGVVALLLLGSLYGTWCWGWWGHRSLLLQYLFRCACPVASEAARYPAQVEVLVPACKDARVIVSPGGQCMRVWISGQPLYMFDFETQQRIALPVPDSYSFVTDSLLLVKPEAQGEPSYLFDVNTLARLSVTNLYWANTPTLADERTLDPAVILPLLRNASGVFLLPDRNILMVMQDRAYTVDELSLTGRFKGGEAAREYLQQHHIPYTVSKQQYYTGGMPSVSGRFVFRQDGIYLNATGERIVENYHLSADDYFFAKGWVYDDRGVVIHNGAHLLDLTWLGDPISHEPTGAYIYVPQPVLLLKVPEQYLNP